TAPAQLIDHPGRGADVVRRLLHVFRAFGMCEHVSVVRIAVLGDLRPGETLVDFTVAAPGNDLDVGTCSDVAGEVFVGNDDDARGLQGLHDLDRVRRGAAYVALGFD